MSGVCVGGWGGDLCVCVFLSVSFYLCVYVFVCVCLSQCVWCVCYAKSCVHGKGIHTNTVSTTTQCKRGYTVDNLFKAPSIVGLQGCLHGCQSVWQRLQRRGF